MVVDDDFHRETRTTVYFVWTSAHARYMRTGHRLNGRFKELWAFLFLGGHRVTGERRDFSGYSCDGRPVATLSSQGHIIRYSDIKGNLTSWGRVRVEIRDGKEPRVAAFGSVRVLTVMSTV